MFAFDDVVLLRTAGHLLADGVSIGRIRSAFVSARNNLPDGVDITQVVLAADGDAVVVSFDGESWDPRSGQAVFLFEDQPSGASVSSLDEVRQLRAMPSDADAEDWFIEGDTVESHDPSAAEDAYRMAIDLDPSHIEAHLNLGRLLHATGDVDGALIHYQAAAHLDPTDATAWFNIGVAYEDVGDAAKAIDGYERAIRMEPAFADAHFNLASVYESQHSELAALRHRREYQRIRGIGPT